MHPIDVVPLAEIEAARARIADLVLRTPLVRLPLFDVAFEAEREVYLKLENLQPIGSFKLRGAGNAMRAADAALLASQGVWTASAGNMAQGVAWTARTLGVAARVLVPESAPQNKLAALERMGAQVIRAPFEAWWECIVTHRYAGMAGVLVHPFADPLVLAGNGTIGLEIVEDLPDVDAVIVPYGGGGLTVGIASALAAVRPEARVYTSEVSTAAPLAASLRAGSPQQIAHTPSFVDGIGGRSLVAEMWPAVSKLVHASIVVSPEQVASAVRLLVERARVVAEGAGASSLAAALRGQPAGRRIVCIISGGNIDANVLAAILAS